MLVWGNYMSNFDKIGFVFEDSLLYFGFSLLCRKHQQAHYGKFIFQAHLKVLGGTQNPIWTALSRFDSARSKSHWVGKAAEEGAHHRTRRKGGIESRMTPVLAPLGGTCSWWRPDGGAAVDNTPGSVCSCSSSEGHRLAGIGCPLRPQPEHPNGADRDQQRHNSQSCQLHDLRGSVTLDEWRGHPPQTQPQGLPACGQKEGDKSYRKKHCKYDAEKL